MIWTVQFISWLYGPSPAMLQIYSQKRLSFKIPLILALTSRST